MISQIIKFIILFLFVNASSCHSNEKHKNIISFSCIKCKGCVQEAMSQIQDNKLYENHTIYLDKDCYTDFEKNYSFQVVNMSQEDLFENFGRFGNFILFDENGTKTEFKTNMNLMDYVN